MSYAWWITIFQLFGLVISAAAISMPAFRFGAAAMMAVLTTSTFLYTGARCFQFSLSRFFLAAASSRVLLDAADLRFSQCPNWRQPTCTTHPTASSPSRTTSA